MNPFRNPPSGAAFHEMSLVLFTSLVILGAGSLAAHFAAWGLGLVSFTPHRRLSSMAIVFIGAGLVLSLLHLGRPRRMLYSFLRIGRSLLSTEVLLASLVLASAAAAEVLPVGGNVAAIFWGVSAVCAPFLLLLLGWVYRLPSQLSWDGLVSLSPLLLGFAAGMLVNATVAAKEAPFLYLGSALLVIDAAGFGLRWYAMRWQASLGQPAHPPMFRARRRIMTLRFVDVTLIPLLLLLAQAPTGAACVLAFGVFVDRFGFYALALKQTTEAEVTAVEAFLRDKSGL